MCETFTFLARVMHTAQSAAAQGTAPGLSVDFLHSGNMDHVPSQPFSSHPTWETWLPFKNLRESVDCYMEHPEQFPFMKIEESDMTQQVGTSWSFLNKYFSVGKDDSMEFLLEILRCVQRSCAEPSISQSKKVFDLYVAFCTKLAVANDAPEARRKMR